MCVASCESLPSPVFSSTSSPGFSPDFKSSPPLSAEELHRILLKTYIIGNRARKKFIQALLAMDVSRLYLKLGYSSIAQYAEKYFGFQRSKTYECLRVARALQNLPRCESAFEEGKISWSALREITRIATAETEGEWLEFASRHSLPRLQGEVKDASRKGRKTPRKDSYGLPNLKVQVRLDLCPEEHDILEKALKKVAGEMKISLGGEAVEPKDALLYVARRILETEPEEGSIGGRSERQDSLYTILYHRCAECRRTSLPTAEGPVEIPEEVVDRVAGDARKVSIEPEEEVPEGAEGNSPKRDRPNTPALARKVRLRDGGVCANPFCRRKLGLHAHHIRVRSKGGRTALYNEISVCPMCHGLIHAGLLRVEGNPYDGLIWKTRGDEVRVGFREELEDLASVPEIRLELSTAVDSGGERAPGTGEVSGKYPPWLYQGILKAMVKIGYSKKEGRERLEAAWDMLSRGDREPREQEVLFEAVKGNRRLAPTGG